MLRLIPILVVAVGMLALVAGWLWYLSWLVRSGIGDLARRRRILAGADPLQVTAARSREAAEAALDAARTALSTTMEEWYELRESRAVGTLLAEGFPELEATAARKTEFLDLLENAQAELSDPGGNAPMAAADLGGRIASVDALTVQLRRLVHAYSQAGLQESD